MRIAIIVEGKTEVVFRRHLQAFIETQLEGKKMPTLDFVPYDGRIPTGAKLRRVVENLLSDKKQPADAVIALTDVYTGSATARLHRCGRRQEEDAGMGRAQQQEVSSARGAARFRGLVVGLLEQDRRSWRVAIGIRSAPILSRSMT